MPTNFYPQKTQPELLVMLDGLQKRNTTGTVFMTSGAGVQNMRSFQGSSRVEVEIRRVLYSLFRLDPEAYDNPYAGRIRRIRPDYSAP